MLETVQKRKNEREPVTGANRPGRSTLGIYPHISRTELAQATGYDISTVSGILRGRTKLKLEHAPAFARVIGVDLMTLNRDLQREIQAFKRRKTAKEAESESEESGQSNEVEYAEQA